MIQDFTAKNKYGNESGRASGKSVRRAGATTPARFRYLGTSRSNHARVEDNCDGAPLELLFKPSPGNASLPRFPRAEDPGEPEHPYLERMPASREAFFWPIEHFFRWSQPLDWQYRENLDRCDASVQTPRCITIMAVFSFLERPLCKKSPKTRLR